MNTIDTDISQKDHISMTCLLLLLASLPCMIGHANEIMVNTTITYAPKKAM